MRAFQLIRHGSAKDVFKDVEVPKPTLKKEQDVLIKVTAFGLNYADVMARKGLYRAAPALPSILGYEVVGEIVEVKDQTNKSWIGKRVLAMTRFGGLC